MDKAELDRMAGWMAGRLPDGWFTGAPSVTEKEGQVVVVGTLAAPELPGGAGAEQRAGAEAGRIARFREHTRGHRIGIAREVARQFKQDVTWGATCGGTTTTFTPGGSGRREAGEHASGEARQVMIAARRRALGEWHRRFGFGGPPAWRGGPGDHQSF